MENPFEIIMKRLDDIESLIKDLDSKSKEVNQLLNVKEVAALLSVTIPTIYGYTHSSSIPFMKKGKKLYFYKNEIEDWVKGGKRNDYKLLEQKASNYLQRIKK